METLKLTIEQGEESTYKLLTVENILDMSNQYIEKLMKDSDCDVIAF